MFDHASKSGGGRRGYPDFIITSDTHPRIVILVECKAYNYDHEKALDEVRWYASFLEGVYDVVKVAVSGTTEETLKITTEICRKDGSEVDTDRYNTTDRITRDTYDRLIGSTKAMEAAIRERFDKLKADINTVLDKADRIKPEKRMLLLSTCLLALKDDAFKDNFDRYIKTETLLEEMLVAIRRVLRNINIPREKEDIMMPYFETIKRTPQFMKPMMYENASMPLVKYVLTRLHHSDFAVLIESASAGIDIMGEFYSAFVSQVSEDAKEGFAITPRHICELFTELAQLDTTTRVVDMCFGTGSFLVAALQKEIATAKGNDEVKKENQGEQHLRC